jgi:ferric-dicitrate binding protein FerR (iron transport regulator)
MYQEEKQTYYLDLGTKYLSKNASKQEIKELEEWVAESPENKRLFMEFKKTWALAGIADSKRDFNLEDNWKSVSEKLFDGGKTIPLQPIKSRRWWLRIAASLFLLVAATMVYRTIQFQEKPILVQTTDNIEDVKLSDGSEVNLNRSSSIEFIANNDKDQREILLKGDAFFDIARDVDHSFIIKTQNLEVEVLGTSFYVDSRESKDEIQVLVASGTVAVRVNGEETVLQENERAIFNKSNGQLIKETTNDPNVLALKTKTLIFDNTRLEDVIEILNRYYLSDIRFGSDELKNCELESTFRDMSLDSILEVLSTSFAMKINRTGQAITLTGKCD